MSDLHSIQRSSEFLQKKTAGVSPCWRSWYTENHLGCFRLTTAVLTACVWQFWIRDYTLIVTPSLKSLNRSPFLHTVSKALLVDVPKKMTKMLLCSGLILFLADQRMKLSNHNFPESLVENLEDLHDVRYALLCVKVLIF